MMIKIIPLLISFAVLAFPIPSEVPAMGDHQVLSNAVVHVAEAAVAPTQVAEEQTTRKVWVTAYSSTPDQTDSTPFVTAMGSMVRDGIIATNIYPFGTKIQIPKFFGTKTFVVEDRMHVRKKNFVDIWMPSRHDAMEFGIAFTDIVVLN
ncbi:MAG: hypothetical protein WCW78_00195 [Candidatus Paceibacterota bacterium]|jgi:3D (Asp-Asp-Asp) domain-containing protein